jgi:hypothetical protein
MEIRLIRGVAACGLLAVFVAAAPAAETDALLKTIKSVKKEGAGAAEAAKAWAELVKQGADAIPAILAAYDGADATAANYLRTAVDAIAERESNAGRSLPTEKLEAFVKDRKNPSKGRRLAYELLASVDCKAAPRLLPDMLDDPNAELRRDAVAVALKNAGSILEKGDKPAATDAYRKLLNSARDKDQVDLIGKKLKELGVEVDLAKHFGFVRNWALAAPFDSTEGKGYARLYPPEVAVDLEAIYPGKKEEKVRWKLNATTDLYGVVNLNKVIGKHKGAAAFAYAEIDSPEERPVELRAGCITALKVFLNGKQVFAREEYHHGMDMDQHIGRGTLKKGRNEVLLKVCQNEQTEPWAQEWQFQLRICDALGGAVPMTVLEPKIKTETPEGKVQK